MTRYRAAAVGGCVEATLEARADGSLLLRSTEPLGDYPRRLSDRLEHWATEAPDRVFVARRDGAGGGGWRAITYAQMLQRARAVGQALLEARLSVSRPVVILSGNDLEHLTMAMGAMWAGVPCIPVSTAYSLVSTDFGKLRQIFAITTPGLVFAANTTFAGAIDAVVGADVAVVLAEGRLESRPGTSFDEMLATGPGPEVDAAHAATTPDTILKILFTSGSTRQPKGVITTHRMMCSNQQMLRQCMAFLAEEPPVVVDWLPWSHTFGGSHNIGIVLYNGGTFYIDDGRPTPGGIAETVRNLKEIPPTIYFNVPKGFEEIARAMDHDEALRHSLFKRVKAFMFAAAGLSQTVWDKLDAHGERTIGERVRVITGLGMTETSPACTFKVGTDARSGHIGLPCPGVDVKLVPLDGKTELRFRGPNVMPGYWRAPEQTADAFDEEGFYRTGDAAKFVDPEDYRKGLLFDGRIAEDFKLSTGTFVNVGPLRARMVMAGYPCVLDVVLTGVDRDEVGALVFPRLHDCASLAGLAADTPASEVLRHPAVSEFFQRLCDRMWREGTGGANRIARLQLQTEPASIDKGEITDKGSFNQRAVLVQRAAAVEKLHATLSPVPLTFMPGRQSRS